MICFSHGHQSVYYYLLNNLYHHLDFTVTECRLTSAILYFYFISYKFETVTSVPLLSNFCGMVPAFNIAAEMPVLPVER